MAGTTPQPAAGPGGAAGGRRPLVAVPARFSASASALRHRADVAATALVEAVDAAGGEPLVVHPSLPDGASTPAAEADAVARERIRWADAVLLPGGGDLAAHWSGQAVHGSQYDVDDLQDAFDLALARVALADGVPMLAVCRGLQVVNVALGGDLVQDLTETLGRDHRHVLHDVAVVPDSALGPLVPDGTIKVSCYHHQGLRRLGAGVRPIARAEDGTVEAASLDGAAGWFLGLQWHPEDTAAEDPLQQAILRSFIDAAR